MEPRQINALVLAGVGVLLMAGTEPLRNALSNSPPLILAGVSLLSPVGLVLLVLGIYRYSSKGTKP